HIRKRLVRRRHLIQPAPANRIIPGFAHFPPACINRTGRRILAGEGVARIKPPQPTIVQSPARHRIEQLWLVPLMVLARANRNAISTRIIDEWHAKNVEMGARLLWSWLVMITVPLYETVPDPRNTVTERHQRHQEGQLQLRQILAPHVIAGVGAGAGIDDRMVTYLFQLRVIPMTAQIITREIV